MLVFFNFVFQFSSIFCSVLAQTVEEPFFAAFCHIPNLCGNRRNTLLKNEKIRNPQLQTPAGDSILSVRWLIRIRRNDYA